MRRLRWGTLAALGLAASLLVLATAAGAQGGHGLGGSTNCSSPTKIGAPVFCTYTIRNNSDDFGDTMLAHSVIATAQGAGGSVISGNVFSSLQWVFTPAPGDPGAPTCTGGSGLGTALSPRVGATSCNLPDEARIQSLSFTFYTAQPADFTLPGDILPMLADYAAADLCDAPGTENCPVADLTVGVNSQTAIVKRDSATATQIHNAAHQPVTTVEVGSTVHDFVSVTSTDGGPVPAGNVNIDWFLNGDCSGAPAANSGSIGPLDAAGNLDATGFNFTVGSTGMRAFRAHYEGSGSYEPSDGDCEPLQVEGAGGQITPTQVSCQDFIGGSAPTLDQINYTVSGGKIAQGINPGVFFYWTTITTTVPNQVVTTSQTNTSTNNSALFKIHQDWQRLYTGNCSSWTTGTQIAGGTAASFTVATPGTYVIGIKYDVKSLAGTTPPVPANITFDFSTSLGGNTGASVLLKKS
jgi:hypothetical protein